MTNDTLTEQPQPASGGVPWPRFAALATLAAAAYVLTVGLVTAIIPNPVFGRVVAVNVWNLLSLLLPGILFGAVAATYLVPWPQVCRVNGRLGAGSVLSFLAAGCPVCNKLVVLALGTTGALNIFRPLQPLLGVLSVILLSVALNARLKTRASAIRPAPPDAPRGQGVVPRSL